MCDRCAISSRDSAVSRSWLISRRQQWSRWVYRHIFSSSVPAVGHTCLLYIYRGHCVEDVFSNCDIACCVFTAWCNFARCMSVCLSHASGMSKRLNIVTLFFQSLCHITLVLAVANVVAILHHHPPHNGVLNAGGVRKGHNFWQLSCYISETIEYTSRFTVEGEWKTAPKLSSGIIFNDLEWPLTHCK